ncbi:G-PROTEIN-RECEP-F1-2 domain-containing protein [Aphelenchoides fujianensis]|nr:G-PROTEIN-RECEP-F1-2 domain-containing protein [Aphelenchoides fujianensis]
MDDDLWLLEESAYFNVCDIRPHDAETSENQVSCQAVDEERSGLKKAIALVWWTNVVFLPAIAVLGLLCNLLNLLVLTSNKAARRMPSWHFLVALACFDSLFLLFALWDVTPGSLHFFLASPTLNALYTRTVLYVRVIASTCFRASILIVVAFNLERYVCVCRPLWAHRMCTSRTSKLAVLVSFLIAFGCSLQWPLVYKVAECWDAHNEHKYFVITMSDDPTLQAYFSIMNYVSLVLFNLLPICLLLILNILLVRTLRRVVDQDRRRSSGADTQEMLPQVQLNQESGANRLNANTMLLAVVLLLLLCIGPQAPARLLADYYGLYDVNVVHYICITQLLVFCNASLNFCLYCLVSKRYRALLRDSLRKLTKKEGAWCRWMGGVRLKSKFTALLLPPTTLTEEHLMLDRAREQTPDPRFGELVVLSASVLPSSTHL